MKAIIYFLFFLPVTFSCVAQKITGSVFVDSNNNGIRDGNESGVERVSISDQVQVLVTDAQGNYELVMSNGKNIVMISIPDGYRVRDKFWNIATNASNGRVDFPLIKTQPKKEFTFIHASDTHISEKSVYRMEKFRQLVDETEPDFVLVTGDLVKDALRVSEGEALRYYKLYVEQIQKIKQSVWSVPGNHENFGIERHLSLVGKDHPLYGKKMYQHFLGPTYYSFNYGGIHFIGLDDVFYEDTWYYGHVDSVQLQWLKRDLEKIPASMPIVTFAHIPFFSGGLSMTEFTAFGPARTLEVENGKQAFRHVVSNAKEVFALFKSYNYPLNLTGHYHARQVFWYESMGQKIRFEQTGAVVGPAREGDIEFPSGVTLYSVKDGVISEGKFLRLE